MLTNILFLPRTFKTVARLFSTYARGGFLSPERFERYYKPQLHLYDSGARAILEQMTSRTCNKSMVLNSLGNYLEIYNKRTPKGLLGLICAINDCTDVQIRDYCRHLLEYIIRTEDISQFACDKEELGALLIHMGIKREQSFEKIKEALVKYRMAELLMVNLDVIHSIHFYDIIALLTSNDRFNVMSNSRFLTLATAFNQKLLDQFRLYLKGEMKPQDVKRVSLSIISSIIYYFREFPTRNDEEAKLLFEFIDRAVFENPNKQFRRIILYNIHRCFPYSSKDPHGEYYKDIVLRKLVEKEKTMQGTGEDWNQALLCYSILSFEFYKVMENIQFRYEGDLNYLKKEDLKIPELPKIFWDKYTKTPALVNKDHIARNILKRVYTERYISTPQVESSTIKPPKISENEIKVRMDFALQSLGRTFKREVEVSGRYVDFLVDDIVIECDGDYHFDLYKMEYNETTQFRNLHLLLSGYRLLIINIFEYNKHRKTQALAELIKQKLSLMEKHDAVMII